MKIVKVKNNSMYSIFLDAPIYVDPKSEKEFVYESLSHHAFSSLDFFTQQGLLEYVVVDADAVKAEEQQEETVKKSRKKQQTEEG